MRPKIVLVVGNGLTISLAHHLGISETHNTRQLIPPPEWVQEASKDFSGKQLPLWSQRRYPELFAAWHDLADHPTYEPMVTQFHALCASLAKNTSFRLGPDPEAGPLVMFHHRDAGYQLRRYLWHLFFLYNGGLLAHVCPLQECRVLSHDALLLGLDTIIRSFQESTTDWPLMNLLRSVANDWELSIVSFNYDSYVESFLRAHGHEPFMMGDRCFDFIDQTPARAFRVIKPHGCMSHLRPGISGPELEFLDDAFEEDLIVVVNHEVKDYFPSRSRYPYAYPCPDYPDLVPPGHAGDHLLARWSDYPRTIRRLIADADMIGCIGFSAAAPDDGEFTSYVSTTKTDAFAFSLGVRRGSSQQIPSEQILANAVGDSHHAFFDAMSQVEECQDWLLGHYQRLTKRRASS